ncbi:MAG: UDP-N-acetylmuramoyl-L-alanine--D-glutamate ligase [Tannerella sp.]|jgi:UDP-N-acetylmuramoylalanine--D-glutamate ligase|nr:UDP-N-acetylmuramoyl-L-alanine--D-glutamate ligase [Tannerella sp.]
MSKRIVILGGGESGVGAAVLAKAKGFDVFVSDLSTVQPKYRTLLDAHHIAWEENRHTEKRILQADEIVKSPGISDRTPIMQAVLAQNIPVVSEIEFAGRYIRSRTICITGSNGKTTTATLTYHILKQAGADVGLAGNVGNSLALQAAESPHDYYVIELSSFQLDNMYDFKADIAVLLNITPDHLDRYHCDFQKYVDAKFRILRNQTEQDAFIFWNGDRVITREIEKHPPRAALYPFSDNCNPALSGYVKDGELVVNTTSGDVFSMKQSELALKGVHNLYNSMAAIIAARILGTGDGDIRRSLGDFRGVEHRMERVACIRGVEYINDSKATNVNSCRYALQSMQTKTALILGGTDKGNDYSEIEHLVREKVRALIFMGVDNAALHMFFDGKIAQIADARSMEEAVKQAAAFAQEGDAVLLSPCCASFDLFRNYEDRGRQFKDCVKNLARQL